MLKRKLKKGFTLVELVVVIAVIAILSAVSVGAYFGITDSANNSKVDQEGKAVRTQLHAATIAGLTVKEETFTFVNGTGITFTDGGELVLADFTKVATVGATTEQVLYAVATTEPTEAPETATIVYVVDERENAITSFNYYAANLGIQYARNFSLSDINAAATVITTK